MSRVSKKYVLISLPDHAKSLLRLTIKLPFIKEKNFQIRIPSIDTKKYWVPSGHEWELGNIYYPFYKVKKEIKKTGLKIFKSYIDNGSPMTKFIFMEKM